jgi:hypothetical protein
MGLRQKSKRIRFGFLEYVALILAVLTVAAGVLWLLGTSRSNWVTVPARVEALSMETAEEGAATDASAMRLHFVYIAGGSVYNGDARFDRLARMVFGALPEEIQESLRSKGYMSFEDLPPKIQKLLGERGISSFDHVPIKVLDALRAHGYNSPADVPEEIRSLLRAGKYKEAAEVAGFSDESVALLIADSMVYEDRSVPGGAERGEAEDGVLEAVSTVTGADALSEGTTLYVRYDPAAPSQYEVVRVPYLDKILSLGVVLALAAATLLYCVVLYPRLKSK